MCSLQNNSVYNSFSPCGDVSEHVPNVSHGGLCTFFDSALKTLDNTLTGLLAYSTYFSTNFGFELFQA